ncbi:MAG TPA: hypothetical protein VNH46_00300 [Gemmatimonadales bacterium]|nr:hypothetical protein [Gemmatimonadales bacterium]
MRVPLAASLLILPALLVAQEAAPTHEGHGPAPRIEGGGVFPAGWHARLDQGGRPAEVKLETMPPGWHITTAAATILYRDQDRARGRYELSARMHLFPEGPGHREAFGLFIGGQDLQGAGQRYTYFLIRGDGTWKVKRRAGADATDVTSGWTANPAIAKSDGKQPVANLLGIVVGADRVSFRVNGTEVYAAPAAGLDVAGQAGVRINHNLSVHLETLEVKQD